MTFKFHSKFLIYLIAAVCNVGAQAGSYEDFFQAISRDDGAVVSALLRRGFDPNTRDEQGQAALFVALRAPAPKAANALWAHPGLDVHAVNSTGETPLMMAALRGNLDWTRRLLERGAKVHHDGWAPVHYAATGPNVDVLKLLLDKGAPVNAPSPNGSTPLMMAARYGSEDSVDLLLGRGANPKLRNQRDANAADFARMGDRDQLAGRLAALAR